ncbi:hypothetical protein G6F40_017893 [Rhizopus arrhizus]|nr:hypothetical protein G6F40_017893 [Rhizopus arrhizus]
MTELFSSGQAVISVWGSGRAKSRLRPAVVRLPGRQVGHQPPGPGLRAVPGHARGAGKAVVRLRLRPRQQEGQGGRRPPRAAADRQARR